MSKSRGLFDEQFRLEKLSTNQDPLERLKGHIVDSVPCHIDFEYFRKPFETGLRSSANALGVSIAELFTADETFKDVNSVDKTLMEKISLIELLDKKEKTAFFAVLDAFVGKKKLKDNLFRALQQVQ